MAFQTAPIAPSLTTLFAEIMNGSPGRGGFLLNGGDPGLLHSLDRLSAEDASAVHSDGASIAAHADHLLYGLGLFNRWADGEENPWASADWTQSWHRGQVDAAGWEALRQDLRRASARWLDALGEEREVSEIELSGMIGSIAHTAYHMGAIRQMDRASRGPGAED